MEKITFKGKEFKGSEGEFRVYGTGKNMHGYGQPVAIAEYNTENLIAGLFGDVRGGEPVCEANARLFVNSKNLLKAAIEYFELLKKVETDFPQVWQDITAGTGIATCNKFEHEILKSL